MDYIFFCMYQLACSNGYRRDEFTLQPVSTVVRTGTSAPYWLLVNLKLCYTAKRNIVRAHWPERFTCSSRIRNLFVFPAKCSSVFFMSPGKWPRFRKHCSFNRVARVQFPFESRTSKIELGSRMSDKTF